MKKKFLEGRPAEILLVEDNLGDVVLTRECLAETPLHINLSHVENGEECLAFLRKEGRYAGAPTPDLIMLDLNMPKMDGREVLTEMMADERLCHLPVVVLTTSAGCQDVLDMHRLRCNSYIVKPVEFDRFQDMVRSIAEYWFGVVALPGKG